ncbi:MAG TPA: helix-turn-helix transcriptional regulator [Solirubrobacterales bacterium]|jgi:DNA-binding XRE family transcriptional regulator
MYLDTSAHSSGNVPQVRHSQRPQPALGAAIRELREKREVSQVSVAKDAGLTGETLSLIERGHANPTWATARDIAAALGVSIAELAKLSEKHE